MATSNHTHQLTYFRSGRHSHIKIPCKKRYIFPLPAGQVLLFFPGNWTATLILDTLPWYMCPAAGWVYAGCAIYGNFFRLFEFFLFYNMIFQSFKKTLITVYVEIINVCFWVTKKRIKEYICLPKCQCV